MLRQLISVFSVPSFLLLFTCMLLQGIAVSLTTPFLPLYFTDVLDVSIRTYGFFLSFTTIVGILVNTYIGKRSDLGMNRKHLYLVAILCNAANYIGYLLIDNIYILFVYMVFFTALAAPGMSQLFAISREAINKSNYSNPSFANSTLRSGFSLGFILGPIVGATLIKFAGLNGIFIGSIVVILLVASLVSLFLKDATSSKEAKVHMAIKAFKLKDHPKIIVAFLIIALMYTAHWMSTLNTALFITNYLGGDTSDVGIISSICAALEIPFMLTLGTLATKFGNRLIILGGAILAALYYVIIIFSVDMWQLIASQFLLAVFVAIIAATGISYIQDLLPQMPGYASSLYSIASTVGKLAGSLIGGIVASIIGYRYVFIICLMVMLVAIVLNLFSNRYDKDSESSSRIKITH